MYYIAIWIMIFVIKQYYNLKLFQGTNLSPTVSNMSDETGVIFMAILFLSFIITLHYYYILLVSCQLLVTAASRIKMS